MDVLGKAGDMPEEGGRERGMDRQTKGWGMEVRGPNLIICYIYFTTETEGLLPGEDLYFCPQALNLTLKTLLSLPRLLLIFLSLRTPLPFPTSLPRPFSWSLSPGTLCPKECRKCENRESLSHTQDTCWLLSLELCVTLGTRWVSLPQGYGLREKSHSPSPKPGKTKQPSVKPSLMDLPCYKGSKWSSF